MSTFESSTAGISFWKWSHNNSGADCKFTTILQMVYLYYTLVVKNEKDNDMKSVSYVICVCVL